MSRRYGLQDEQWSKIENLLPSRKASVGVTAKDNRLFVEAVLYRYRSGYLGEICPRDLEIIESFILVLPVGQQRAYGRGYFEC